MRLISISNDKKIFDPNSAVAKRQIEYAKNTEETHILIRSKKREITLSSNLWVYGSYFRYFLAKKIVKNSKITHITCQDPFENGLIGTLLKKRNSIILELQLHTDLYAQNWIRRFLAKYNFVYADKVRVVSNYLKDQVKKYIEEDKIEVRPIVVDIEKIKNTERTERPSKKIILCVSRLEKEKRVEMAIEAMKGVSGAELWIVGEGLQRRKLEAQSKMLPVKFFGWQDDTAKFYKNADIFLNTSKYEGYGMSLVEAHAAGLKILSTDVGVARDVGAIIINDSKDIIKNI